MTNRRYQYLILLPLFLFLYLSVKSQPPALYWEHFFGGNAADFLGYMQKTSDNGFVIAGHGQSKDGDLTIISSGGASDFEIIRLDSCGNKIWGKVIGGNFIEYLNSVTETTEHGFLLTGYTLSTNLPNGFHGGVQDAVACKIDANGNLQWIKTFGGSGIDIFNNAISLPDSSCIAVGWTTSINGDGNPLGNNDSWIVKLDKNGNIIWKKFPAVPITNDIKLTSDGNFILCGGNTITKIDALGNLLWQKTFIGALYSIEKAKANGYIVGGSSFDNTGISEGYALRIDDNGNLIWQKSVGGSLQDEIRHVTVMTDNTFVFAGYSTSSDKDVPFNNGLTDGFTFAFDDNGVLLWTKSYGGNGRDEFHGVTSGSDGSVILSGFTGLKDGNTSTSPQKWDFMMLKLRDKKIAIIDTFSCKPLIIDNTLISHDTTVTDSLKDICNYDSAYIKYNVTIKTETVQTISDVSINFGQRITLLTTASRPVTWSGAALSCYNCLSPVAFPKNVSNTYIVKTVGGSCTAIDTVIIGVKATDTLYVPSAFTPNGDGNNDVFNALGIVSDFSLEIYNRWGERIFKTNSLNSGWDGTFKGAIQPTGTFVYFIRYKNKAAVLKQLKGTFTLIR